MRRRAAVAAALRAAAQGQGSQPPAPTLAHAHPSARVHARESQDTRTHARARFVRSMSPCAWLWNPALRAARGMRVSGAWWLRVARRLYGVAVAPAAGGEVQDPLGRREPSAARRRGGRQNDLHAVRHAACNLQHMICKMQHARTHDGAYHEQHRCFLARRCGTAEGHCTPTRPIPT